ncbi:MAG: hypothetical protein OXF06_02240 [Bacteroidetes bacterium]|nr:hypothetical protein [Bacteroidota bacterium]
MFAISANSVIIEFAEVFYDAPENGIDTHQNCGLCSDSMIDHGGKYIDCSVVSIGKILNIESRYTT